MMLARITPGPNNTAGSARRRTAYGIPAASGTISATGPLVSMPRPMQAHANDDQRRQPDACGVAVAAARCSTAR